MFPCYHVDTPGVLNTPLGDSGVNVDSIASADDSFYSGAGVDLLLYTGAAERV